MLSAKLYGFYSTACSAATLDGTKTPHPLVQGSAQIQNGYMSLDPDEAQITIALTLESKWVDGHYVVSRIYKIEEYCCFDLLES